IERGDEASLAYSASTDDDGGWRCFKPRAHNTKALRMGEVILIVDSDTIDCFRDAARELAECPIDYVLPRIHPKCPIFFCRRYRAGRSSLFRLLTLPAVSRSVPSWHAQMAKSHLS
ncbi:hypothetical protein BGY98DRAFT_1038987, partial [Russula aff. rugulosa BPL654]